MGTSEPNARRDDEHIPMPRLVGAREIAEMLGICVSQTYELARDGTLPCVRLKSSVRFDPIAVAEWCRAQQVRS